MAPLAQHHHRRHRSQHHEQSFSSSPPPSHHKRKNRVYNNNNINQYDSNDYYHHNSYYHNSNLHDHHNTNIMMNGYCPTLSWRLDPDESLSDWILTVVAVYPHQRQQQQLQQQKSQEQGEGADGTTSSSATTASVSNRLFFASSSMTAHPTTTTTTSSMASATSSSSKRLHFSTPYSKKYFVHRTQLGVGPRRSEYFAKLFQTKSQLQQQSQPKRPSSSSSSAHNNNNNSMVVGKTRIELHPMAADAFPIMLDFMYASVGTPPNVTTDTAVALRQLATSFGIRELFEAVTDFIQQDLTTRPLETAVTYLLHADMFQQDKLAQAAMSLCAEHFEHLKMSQLAQLSPELLERVIIDCPAEFHCSSEVLSARVAAYCRCRPGSIDAAMLQRMTDPRLMPRIAHEESIFYLRLLDEIMSDATAHDHGTSSHDTTSPTSGGGGNNTSAERGKSLAQTSDLYKRCIDACHETIRSALVAERKSLLAQQQQQQQQSALQDSQLPRQSSSSSGAAPVHKISKTSETTTTTTRQTRNTMLDYHKLPDWMKVDILESALVQCPSPEQIRALELVKTKSQERHASETAVQVAYLNTELDKLHKMYEKKMASYQAMLDAQEQELRAYLAELSKFVRVPNEYRVTPLLSEYTYQRRLELDEYGEPMYGLVPPDDLPRFLPPQEDGWVLFEEQRGSTRNNHNHHNDHPDGQEGQPEQRHRHHCWPMFYYKGDLQMKA